jgi:DNA-binding MarR family transcriptional regulator
VEPLPTWLLTQTAAYTHRIVADTFERAGARGYHYRLLRSLVHDGPASQADLGRRLGIHLSDMVKALNELQKDGYLARKPDKTDKRRNVISITDKGRKRADQLEVSVQIAQQKLLEPLDAAEQAQLTALLTKLFEHHSRQGFPPLPSM